MVVAIAVGWPRDIQSSHPGARRSPRAQRLMYSDYTHPQTRGFSPPSSFFPPFIFTQVLAVSNFGYIRVSFPRPSSPRLGFEHPFSVYPVQWLKHNDRMPNGPRTCVKTWVAEEGPKANVVFLSGIHRLTTAKDGVNAKDSGTNPRSYECNIRKNPKRSFSVNDRLLVWDDREGGHQAVI